MAEQLTEADKHHRVVLEKLKKFLSKGNPSDVLIIKSHLICEYYINQILILRGLCTPETIYKISFSEKLEKALDKGDSDEKSSYQEIKKLNRLRNKIGHELEYSLSESDIDDLGFLRGKAYILEKYDFETLPELLRNTLVNIVIDISFIVFKIVDTQKKATKKISDSNEIPKVE